MNIPYSNLTEQQRINAYNKLIKDYPDRLPIVIIGNFQLKKNKLLVPKELSFFKFSGEIRKQIIDLRPYEALYFLITDQKGHNGITPMMNSGLLDLYNRYKSTDGFLYIAISKENTFG